MDQPSGFLLAVLIGLIGNLVTILGDGIYNNGTYQRFVWYGNISLTSDYNASETSEYRGGSDGIEARPGEFPYMAWTKARYSDGLLPCAGTLISSEWIITDATCARLFDTGYGIIPVFDGTSPEGRDVKKYSVAQKVSHEGFQWVRQGRTAFPGRNNIGLLKMAEPIPAAQGFTPVLLPPAGAFKGQGVFMMPSWGRNAKGQNHKSLRYSKIETHDLAWCKQFEAERRRYNSYFREHGDKMLCNNPAQSSLAYDLSSPLVKKGADPSKDVLIGIQSLDLQSYRGPSLTVFMDIGAYRDWIKQKSGV